MRPERLVLPLICLALLFVACTPDAHADFWTTVGRKSGPGPFQAFEWVFPFTFNKVPRLTRTTVNSNNEALNRFFFDGQLPPFSSTVEDFFGSERQTQHYGEVLGIPELIDWQVIRTDDAEAVGEAARRFVEIVRARRHEATSAEIRSQPSPEEQVAETDPLAAARLEYELLTEQVLAEDTARVQKKIRNFGKSNYIFFGSQAAIPELKDAYGNNTIRNVFLTLAVGYARSLDNKLTYAPNNDADKTVNWLTINPALEWRWGMTSDYSKNLFANVGPTYHYFYGDAFENFATLSLRGRLGMRIKAVHFGLKLEYFADGIPHTDWGSLPDGEVHRIGWGGFIGFEIPALVWK